MSSEILEKLLTVVGSEGLCTEQSTVMQMADNSLGIEHDVLGVVYPQTTEEVQQVVKLANEYHVALYPYSAGRNIGYGERMPVKAGNLLVDLGRMNKILHVDEVLGYADVQPGVTQSQLSDYLYGENIPFYGDSTGSGTMSSVIGNFVDGGYGTTPRGNKRKEMTCVKGVYGNGELFDTGRYPGSIGPDLAGLFVQSNFGIITEVRQPLNAVTEDFRTMIITLKSEDEFGAVIDTLRQLKQQGTLTAQLVITNALDALGASSVEIPEKYKNKQLTNEDAKKILGVAFGSVGIIGGVYGSKAEVKAKCKTIRTAFSKNLQKRPMILFVTTGMLGLLSKLLSVKLLNSLPVIKRLSVMIDSLAGVHGIMQGIPTDINMKGLLGSVRENYGNLRLMWCSSCISSNSKSVMRYIEITEACYKKHGYEFPLEMLMVTPNDFITLQKIDWKKGNEEQEGRGRALYKELSEALKAEGIYPYRLGVHSQTNASHWQGRLETLNALKSQFDPNGIISPGRYGIGESKSANN